MIMEQSAKMKNKKKLLLPTEWSRQPVCLVSSSLALVFRMSQLCAVAPVKFESGFGGRRVRVSPSLYKVGYIVMTIMNAMGLVGLAIDLNLPLDQSARLTADTTQKILWVGDFMMVMLIASLAAYGGPHRVKEIILCLNRVQKIKLTLHDKKAEPNIWNERKKCVVLISFASLSVFTVASDYGSLVDWVLDSDRSQDTVIVSCLYISYEAAYIMLILLEAQFTVSVLEINEVLNMLNNALESVMQPVFSIIPPSKTAHGTIHHLAATYNILCDVIRRLDYANGPSLMLLLASCLLHLVITPNRLIGNFSNPSTPKGYVVLGLCWCALHLFRIVLIIEPPHMTMIEIERTNLMVGKLMLQDRSPLVSEELEKFCKYLLINKVAYSPMGVCTLSRSLLASMMGSVATYLVIIIQFQALDASNKFTKS